MLSDQTQPVVGRSFAPRVSDQYDPKEPCWACGYAIGVHSTPNSLGAVFDEGGCPTEIAAYQRWGVL